MTPRIPRTARPLPVALACLALAAGLAAAPSTAQADPATQDTQVTQARSKVRVSNGCLRSVPEPGTTTPVKICYTLFRPKRASRSNRVPLILHSHGWAGSRTKDPADFRRFLDRGYAVLSFDQRGWGESGGKAHVENPDVEGHDVRRLVKLVSRLRWVRQDGRGDPRLGAIGGSYGGGYQYLAAFEELRVQGEQVLDALAPEITWHDLSESLAPEGVVRTAWAVALSAGSLPSDALPPNVYKALVEGTLTGRWPDGSIPGTENLSTFFRKNGPKWHVARGRRLDVPVLMGQGTTDTLFNLQQGIANWRTALTKRARKRSIFVAYNGGHVLPAILPPGVDVTSDPCSRRLAGGDFQRLSIEFFDHTLKGRKTRLRGWGKMHLATPGSRCVTVRSERPTKQYAVGTVATLNAVNPPTAVKIADGPLRVAGSPHLTGSVTALGVDNRAFYGLAVGTSPLDARLVQNNVLPLSEPAPVTNVRRRVTLPSVAVDVPKGQSLFLLATAVSDTFVLMGSRVPGAITIADTVVHVPVVRR